MHYYQNLAYILCFDNLIHCLKCCCYDKDPIGNKHLCFYGLSLGANQ